MPKKKDFCLILEKCWYPVSFYRLENLILFYCCFIYIWCLFAQKYTVLLSTLQRNASTVFCSQRWTPRRQGDENPNPSVVAETLKLLANSSYGYQIMNRSGQSLTKYLTDRKTYAATNSKLFKRLDHVNNSLYEVETAKAQIEHKEPIIVGFFILQNSKLLLVGAVLQFLYQILWCNQFRRAENGHRLSVSCSCREKTGKLHQTWNENGMAEVAMEWLCR